jgi:hypothetical protein
VLFGLWGCTEKSSAVCDCKPGSHCGSVQGRRRAVDLAAADNRPASCTFHCHRAAVKAKGKQSEHCRIENGKTFSIIRHHSFPQKYFLCLLWFKVAFAYTDLTVVGLVEEEKRLFSYKRTISEFSLL